MSITVGTHLIYFGYIRTLYTLNATPMAHMGCSPKAVFIIGPTCNFRVHNTDLINKETANPYRICLVPQSRIYNSGFQYWTLQSPTPEF